MLPLRRSLHIATKLLPLFWTYSRYKNNPESEQFQETIVRVRHTFQELGATFIKLGQLLSARPDIAGPQLAEELRNLLDNQTPLSYYSIAATIEKELGQDIDIIFKSFDKTALSTASIGQVHKAILKNSHLVAVKVQHTHLAYSIKHDLTILHTLAQIMDKTLHYKGISFTYIWEEFNEWIQSELDFQNEGKKADRLGENLNVIEDIHIPSVYWKYTTKKVIVTEYVEGLTINQILRLLKDQKAKSVYDMTCPFDIDFDRVIRTILDALVKQIFVDKYFHGDLHPANIIISKHNKVSFVDFGVMGVLDEREHTQILIILLALVENDPQSLIKLLLSFSRWPVSGEQKNLLYQELSRELHRIHGGEIDQVSINHFITMLFMVGKKYDIVWTSGLVLAAKTLAQIDAIAKEFRLKTSVVDVIRPSIDHYLLQSFHTKYSKEGIYKAALRFAEVSNKLPESLSELEQIIHEGIPLKVMTPELTQKKVSTFSRKLLLIVLSITISVFAMNSPYFPKTDYPLMFTLIIAFMLFILLDRLL